MCGIAGILGDSGDISYNIGLMISHLGHRGPDNTGKWVDSNQKVALGHTRLSIIDLSSEANQPMLSNTGRFIITFNGEIYNHLELRKQLNREFSGIIKWRNMSDSETLVNCVEYWGLEKTLDSLVGMFAFGIWDRKLRSLVLCRDRMGEKPLYYGWIGENFVFGSELKAISSHPMFSGKINKTALHLFFQFGYIQSPMSIYKNIYKLSPGAYLELNNNGNIKKHNFYFQIDTTGRNKTQFPQSSENDNNALEELDALLTQSIKYQQLSDVPVGVFLSGGIDSSLVTSIMQNQSGQRINSFSIGFADGKFDEAKYAKKIAEYLGTNHTELYISESDALNVVPQIPQLFDEPFADSSQIPTYLVSKLAKSQVSVALSGDGGDELFGGYSRYLWTDKINNIKGKVGTKLISNIFHFSKDAANLSFNCFGFPRNIIGNLERGEKVFGTNSLFEIYKQFISVEYGDSISRNGIEIFRDIWKRIGNDNNNIYKMSVYDMLTYLPNDILCKVDRAAMGVSLETRVPLLNHNIIDFALKIPNHLKIRNGKQKWILRQLLKKYLPEEYFERKKQGFAVPLKNWLSGPLREYGDSLINSEVARSGEYYDYELLKNIWSDHLTGKRDNKYLLWHHLTFLAWYQEYMSK